MDLVKFLSPKHVILVHGEKPKMATLKGKIETELGMPCYYPANNDTVHIPSTQYVKIDATRAFIRNCLNPNFKHVNSSEEGKPDVGYADTDDALALLQTRDERVAEGILVMEKTKKAKVVHQAELLPILGVDEHKVQFAYCCPVHISNLEYFKSHQLSTELSESVGSSSFLQSGTQTSSSAKSTDLSSSKNVLLFSNQCSWLHLLFVKLSNELAGGNIQEFSDHIQLESFCVSVCLNDNCPYKVEGVVQDETVAVYFCCSWSVVDEKLAWRVISRMKELDLTATPRTLTG